MRTLHARWTVFLHLSSLLVGMLFPSGYLASALLTADESRPNIVLLFADDMRADSIGALGNPTIRTPNLDDLVRHGLSFESAYCLGGNSGAVCTPSRNMLLSGNAYFRWQNFTPPNGRKGQLAPGTGPNLPISFKEAGYFTYHHGKKGNTAPLIQEKFDVNRYLRNDEAERKSGEPGKEIADDAIEFLRTRNEKQPFLMYLAFGNPHDPRVADEKYLSQYDPASIPLPENYLPQHPFNNGEMAVRDERLLPWPRTPEDVRRTLHEYYATITALDFHIGRFLKTLDELQLSDNTIVVFTADQGISVGSHGLLGKQNLYEHGMGVPLFLRGPGIRQGRTGAMVYLLDLYPTLCDLAGIDVPEGIDGKSFKPVIAGDASEAREEIFLSYLRVQRALRDDRWKLIRYPQINKSQLFDLQADPSEMKDLAEDPAHAARVAEMLERMRAWQKKLGDDQPLTVAQPQSAAWSPPAE